MMKYQVIHKTTYAYEKIVSISQNVLRLTPRGLANQVCTNHELDITPHPFLLQKRLDYFGNELSTFSIERPHDQLIISSKSLVTVDRPLYSDRPCDSTCFEVKSGSNTNETPVNIEMLQFLYDSPIIKRNTQYADFAIDLFQDSYSFFDSVLALTNRIHQYFVFDPSATNVLTTVEEFFTLRRGVCQDMAHFQIACLRSMGYSARYVSGYLRTVPPEGQVRLVGSDVSHAWVSVFCGELGWVDVDPTNNILVEQDHITLSWGRDYSDICPIQGSFLGGGSHSMSVSVDVAPEDHI